MFALFLVILFIVLIVIGTPIAFSIGIVSLIGISNIANIPNLVVPMKMFYGLNSFVLLAVPLFILTANLMNEGNITKKLIDLSNALVGHVKGGLAHSNILVSMIFAGVSGSSTADTAGVGKILIPSMIESGYDKETAVGVTAASSTIGGIIPPSIVMVIYGGLTNASISKLFLGGMIPGILIGLGMMFVVGIMAKKKDFPRYEKTDAKTKIKLIRESIPALLTPMIIIGGVVTGWYTATEAAAFSSVYAFLVGMFYYKTIKLKSIPRILEETLKLSSLSLFALATASALGELLGYYRVGSYVQGFFMNTVSSPIGFLAIVVLFFLFVGTFMDAIPAMILFVPIILPAATLLGISNVHLGIIIVITLSIGLVTPPYGLCLLIAASIGELGVERSFKAVLPYISIILMVLVLIIVFPQIVLI
ncbi:TRAP transporter large permease [Maledivibacter halophilus]|uniref:TRAP transporter, DctM subunit n=1 Tax=Maledivibacter halophilus TaxID=36842 RepID=A0A1T5KQW8_9FIRM|nr:TRAP transporter large permease [Maledivibacter halophilus]SKC66164.1 TRAP transporter, DctM subunit [Maledivibacter halophilus]